MRAFFIVLEVLSILAAVLCVVVASVQSGIGVWMAAICNLLFGIYFATARNGIKG